ncbi:MAG: hypothetical protein L6416_00605 [Candidatus Omnitrophica bacterium]|nr:hypothetical protein [Candidatus Omnitrophota bacterium]
MQSNVITYIQIFFRRRYLFLYPFVLTVFVVVVLSFVLPKSYISTSLILIEEENVINPLISGLAVSTSVADRLRILRERILSWESLVELTRRLKLDTEVKSQLSYEQLIKDIRANIIVEPRGQQLVSISYQGRNPEKVQLVAKTLTDIFIQKNQQAQSKETDVAVSFLEDQLKFYRYKIKEDEIKRLQQQLEDLLVDSTPKHPLVKSLKERIAKLQEMLGKDDVDINTQPGKAKDKDMISLLILKELQKDSGGETGSLENLGLNAEDIQLTRRVTEGLPLDTSINENIYTMLLQRLETARITQQLDSFKKGTRFTIIDPPRLPLKPVKPDPVKFLMLGIAFGCAVGYGCVFLAEMADQSFKNINDAKVELGLPILGSITAIITEKEFNRRKQSARFSYIVTGVFFALMVFTVFLYSMFK